MVDFESAARVVRTFKAQPTLQDEPVEDMIIQIAETSPRFDTLKEQHLVFLGRAAELENALHNSLPGGVYDLLLGAMLQRKASHFVVAHGSFDNDE